MIRQAISCDVCGAEKRVANTWFVAQELGNEIRLSSWDSRNRSKPDAKHLCGHTCVHKLVDEFTARILAARADQLRQDSDEAPEVEMEAAPPAKPARAAYAHRAAQVDQAIWAEPQRRESARTQQEFAQQPTQQPAARFVAEPAYDEPPTLTAEAHDDEFSSARLLSAEEAAIAKAQQPVRHHAALVAMPSRPRPREEANTATMDAARAHPRNRRTEAWERERQRSAPEKDREYFTRRKSAS